jgi:prepilin-type N-terminal cleavage/methylation domain-containing protein
MPVSLNIQRCRGFSLIELMVVIVITGILAGVALPSFINLMQNARVNSAAEDVLTAFRLARSEAIEQNTRVRVGPSVANGNFEDGFEVRRAADSALIRTFDGFRAGVVCEDCDVTVTFNGMGEVVNTDPIALVLTDNGRSRCVNLFRSGGITTECP